MKTIGFLTFSPTLISPRLDTSQKGHIINDANERCTAFSDTGIFILVCQPILVSIRNSSAKLYIFDNRKMSAWVGFGDFCFFFAVIITENVVINNNSIQNVYGYHVQSGPFIFCTLIL